MMGVGTVNFVNARRNGKPLEFSPQIRSKLAVHRKFFRRLVSRNDLVVGWVRLQNPATMKKQLHQHMVSLALAAVAILVSLAMLLHLVPSPTQMLARGIGDKLDDATPATVALHLTQLQTLQADALPALVDALGSDRFDVSRGARRLIDLEFDRWQELQPSVASKHVEHLAWLLATHTPSYSASSREHARQLTLRILQCPIDREVVDRTQLVATCEIVLRTAGQVVPPVLARESQDWRGLVAAASGLETSDQWRVRRNHEDASLRFNNDLRVEPGWRPVPPIPPPTLPALGVPLPPVAEDRWSPLELPQAGDTPRSAQELGPMLHDRSPRAMSQPSAARQGPRVAFPPASEPRRTAPVAIPSIDELRTAETIVVMRWLLVDAAATIAKVTLSERGFSPVEIRIARQIVDPDPAVRLELVKRLPNIAADDPRLWLLWLSHDMDPDVRRATVAILATSPDPVLHNRLRELELEETDASVMRVVKLALEHRKRGF